MSIERLDELLASSHLDALSAQERDELERLLDSEPALEATAGWDLLIDRVLPHTGIRAERAIFIRSHRGWPIVASLAAALAVAVGIVWYVVATRQIPQGPANFISSATVKYFTQEPGSGRPQTTSFILTDSYTLWKLASFFPQMGQGLRSDTAAGWEQMAEITFKTPKGPITVSVPANPIDVWSEGNGDWPADPSLKPFLRSLAARYGTQEPQPLTSKDLSGTWRGEKAGMKVEVGFMGGDDVYWRVTLTNEKGTSDIQAELKLVDRLPGSVQLRRDSSAEPNGTIIGHFERGDGGTLNLTILPVAKQFSYDSVERFPLRQVEEDAASKRFRDLWVDGHNLHGTWVAAAGGAFEGREYTEDQIARAGHRLEIIGGARLSWHTALRAEPLLNGRFKLDPSKKPKELDLTFTRDGTEVVATCIYELEGDTLKLCYDEGERPSEFKTRAGAGNLKLYVFKRKRSP